MLRCLRSNIDVQFCTSMWDMVNYLINYATKTEKDVCDAMNQLVSKTQTGPQTRVGLQFLDTATVLASVLLRHQERSQTVQADDSGISSRQFARPCSKSCVPEKVLVRADCKLLDFFRHLF